MPSVLALMIRKVSALQPDGRAQELIRSQGGVIATDISTSARTATLLGKPRIPKAVPAIDPRPRIPERKAS